MLHLLYVSTVLCCAVHQASGLHELVNTLSVAPLPLVPRQALQSINTHEEAVSHDIQR